MPTKKHIAAGLDETLPDNTKKSELLFLHLILRTLDMGGRCAVIVPDGVLFGSSRAHVEIRKKLIEDNQLQGVVSMPSGVFKPYAGVSTAVLLFTKGGTTDRIWFYDMSHDGLSLDDKRQPEPLDERFAQRDGGGHAELVLIDVGVGDDARKVRVAAAHVHGGDAGQLQHALAQRGRQIRGCPPEHG